MGTSGEAAPPGPPALFLVGIIVEVAAADAGVAVVVVVVGRVGTIIGY